MKKLFSVNTAFLIIFLLIWIFEIFCSFSYNSILIENKSSIIIAAVLCALLIFYIFFSKFKIGYMGIISLIIISGVTLLILKDSILFYLPIYHNERFVIRECIVIYYTLLTFTFSIVCGIISVIYRFKHS